MDKTLKTIEKYLIFLVALAVPLLVLPVFPDLYNTPKLVLFSVIIGIIILVKSAQIISEQKLDINLSSFDLPILLVAISYLASAIIKSPNKSEAFFVPGTATSIVLLTIFYFLLNQNKENKKLASQGLVFSAFLNSLISLLSMIGLNQKLAFLPQFAKVENFTPLGNNFLTFIFLVVSTPLAVSLIIKESKTVKKIIWGIFILITAIALGGNLYQILPGKKFSPKMAPVKISWEVSVDTIKDSPVFGIGTGSYLTAFNRFRPVYYNSLDIWQLKFANSQNLFLHTMTETGLLGTFALIILSISIFKILLHKRPEKDDADEFGFDFLKIGLGVSFLSLFFSGPYLPPLLSFFTYLSLNSQTKKITFSFEAAQKGEKQSSLVASAIVGLPLIISVLVFFYFGAKNVIAEYTFQKSLDAVSKNDGKEAIDNVILAIKRNPKVDRYHMSLAQLSYLIAQNLAQQEEAEKMTDEKRNTISQLIQQAISEGKTAVSLNPQRADNWELLGNLYKQIMAFAQGSDQFAIQTLSQAVALDPINPNLRISLGGVYFAMGDYENAIDAFKLAVFAKPDFANARYNLAVSYREKGEIERAISEMNATLSLLEENSNDWQIVKKEIEDLESKKKAKEKTKDQSTENLTPPQKTEPVVNPPIELPENANPPSPVAEPKDENQTPKEENSNPSPIPTGP